MVKKTTKNRKFQYKKRSVDSIKQRQKQSSSDFDVYIDKKVNLFSPKEGDNLIRFMPPTWEGAEHHGYDIYVHYSIGPDNQTYLCLEKMKGKKCPICDERRKLEARGDTEEAKKLAPKKRVACYIIDRDDEKESPKIWAMPFTVDRDISNLMVNKRTGAVRLIDHPEEGNDVEFTKEGQKERTKYVGVQISPDQSPLHDDSDIVDNWLDFVTENPIPEMLVYYSYDHINQVFSGAMPDDEVEEDDYEEPDDEDEEDEDVEENEEEDEDDGPPFDEDEEEEDEDEEMDKEAAMNFKKIRSKTEGKKRTARSRR